MTRDIKLLVLTTETTARRKKRSRIVQLCTVLSLCWYDKHLLSGAFWTRLVLVFSSQEVRVCELWAVISLCLLSLCRRRGSRCRRSAAPPQNVFLGNITICVLLKVSEFCGLFKQFYFLLKLHQSHSERYCGVVHIPKWKRSNGNVFAHVCVSKIPQKPLPGFY